MKAISGMTSAGPRIAALALLACAVTFVLVSWRDPGYARLRLADDTAVPVAHRDAARFVVEAAPFSLIELSVNGHRAASAYVPWNAHEVRFDNTRLDTGANVVVARTTLWYAASRRTHTAALRVVDPPGPAAGRAHAMVAARTGAQSQQSRDARTLALDIRQQEVAAALTVRLPRNDRAIRALQAGTTDLATFVDDVFGAPQFNRKPISGFFRGVSPRLSVGKEMVTVRAESGYQPLDLEYLPAFAGEVEIANATDRAPETRRWRDDVRRLHVEDYRLVHCDPEPARTEGGTCVWGGPFTAVRMPVVVSLAFEPFSSVGALRRGLNLPVFAFAPHVVARFLAFLRGFVLAVPMFAYLALSRGRNTRFAMLARRLIVIAVAPDVFDACISAQPDVDGEALLIVPAMRAWQPAAVNLLFVPAVIGLVLALLAACVAQLARRIRSVAGMLVRDAANAVAVAALGFVAIVPTGYLAGNVAGNSVVYPALLGAALAAGLIAALVALDWWTIPGRGALRPLFTVATMTFVVAVAVPIPLVQFGAWAAVPGRAGTAFADPLSPLPLTAAFLRSLAALCPLVFGLLILAAVRRDPGALRLDRAAFARLVLCCYAVLPGLVVIVPVGFALAWSTYDLLRARTTQVVGPSPREGGVAALPIAFAFALAEMLLLLPSETRYLREVHTPFIALEVAGFVAVIVASFIMPALAFAACRDELAGRSGLRKGINVGIWAIACSLPAWFLRSDNVVTAAAVVFVTALFYAVLGSVSAAPSHLSPPLAGQPFTARARDR